MAGRTVWYEDRIRAITKDIPEQAHDRASAEACGIGAKMIRSGYSGTLARDVSVPKKIGPLHTAGGSTLPYAGAENDGATIRPKSAKKLLIRGRGGTRGTGRTTTGGPVVASADVVEHKGKHYIEAMRDAFPKLFIDNLRRLMG
jgi:hypothetical protein